MITSRTAEVVGFFRGVRSGVMSRSRLKSLMSAKTSGPDHSDKSAWCPIIDSQPLILSVVDIVAAKIAVVLVLILILILVS
jgi:hypothetical protein